MIHTHQNSASEQSGGRMLLSTGVKLASPAPSTRSRVEDFGGGNCSASLVILSACDQDTSIGQKSRGMSGARRLHSANKGPGVPCRFHIEYQTIISNDLIDGLATYRGSLRSRLYSMFARSEPDCLITLFGIGGNFAAARARRAVSSAH
jgi:hypothetical protein